MIYSKFLTAFHKYASDKKGNIADNVIPRLIIQMRDSINESSIPEIISKQLVDYSNSFKKNILTRKRAYEILRSGFLQLYKDNPSPYEIVVAKFNLLATAEKLDDPKLKMDKFVSEFTKKFDKNDANTMNRNRGLWESDVIHTNELLALFVKDFRQNLETFFEELIRRDRILISYLFYHIYRCEGLNKKIARSISLLHNDSNEKKKFLNEVIFRNMKHKVKSKANKIIDMQIVSKIKKIEELDRENQKRVKSLLSRLRVFVRTPVSKPLEISKRSGLETAINALIAKTDEMITVLDSLTEHLEQKREYFDDLSRLTDDNINTQIEAEEYTDEPIMVPLIPSMRKNRALALKINQDMILMINKVESEVKGRMESGRKKYRNIVNFHYPTVYEKETFKQRYESTADIPIENKEMNIGQFLCYFWFLTNPRNQFSLRDGWPKFAHKMSRISNDLYRAAAVKILDKYGLNPKKGKINEALKSFSHHVVKEVESFLKQQSAA